jgi:hypothetical protein
MAVAVGTSPTSLPYSSSGHDYLKEILSGLLWQLLKIHIVDDEKIGRRYRLKLK